VGIVGERPETGLRIEVERPAQGGPPWRYAGHVVTPEASHELVCVVQEDGTIGVELAEGAPAAYAEKARLLVRTAFRHAAEDGAPPPRRIVRWRADR
jgi:hypothetical protein